MRRQIKGVVVSNKMDKTAVVEVELKKTHRLYKKQMKAKEKYFVHDPGNLAEIGQEVVIEESRPRSKNKHWMLVSTGE